MHGIGVRNAILNISLLSLLLENAKTYGFQVTANLSCGVVANFVFFVTKMLIPQGVRGRGQGR